MPTIEPNNLVNDDRKCLECGITFKPKVYWQLFCSTKHADKYRKIRQRARIKRALQVLHEQEVTSK